MYIKKRESTSRYHFVESYLKREQIERVLNHYKDYINAALYILHDKDVKRVEDDGGVRRQELHDKYNELTQQINALEYCINASYDELKSRQFESDQEKDLFKRREITQRKRDKTRLQKAALRISDELHELDRQYEENGTLKEPHYHILIKCYGAHTAEAVRKWFYHFHVTEEKVNPETGEKECKVVNSLNRIVDSVAAARDYLTHKNEPEYKNQHVYDVKEVITYGQGWQAFNKAGRSIDDVIDILDRIANGDSLRDLARDYGRDVVINYEKYRYFSGSMHSQEDASRDISSKENYLKEALQDKTPEECYRTLDRLNTALWVLDKFNEITKEISSSK